MANTEEPNEAQRLNTERLDEAFEDFKNGAITEKVVLENYAGELNAKTCWN